MCAMLLGRRCEDVAKVRDRLHQPFWRYRLREIDVESGLYRAAAIDVSRVRAHCTRRRGTSPAFPMIVDDALHELEAAHPRQAEVADDHALCVAGLEGGERFVRARGNRDARSGPLERP